MNLRVNRKVFTETSTVGELLIDEVFCCYTLEDRVRRGPKVYAKTAIPEGTYEIALTFSQRFLKVLPLLLRVPGFEGVRIHPGNTAEDTEGCLLVGTGQGLNKVTGSREAFAGLLSRLVLANKKEKIWVDMRNQGRLTPEG